MTKEEYLKRVLEDKRRIRQELAKLPIEEKVRIVKDLQKIVETGREEEVKGKAAVRELVRQIDLDVQCDFRRADPRAFDGWIVFLSKGEYKHSVKITEEDLEDVDTDPEVSEDVRKKFEAVITKLGPEPQKIGF